jgi:type I restriction enzyme S subunit
VPEHWRVVRSGSIFRLFGGFAFSGSGFIRGDDHSNLPIVLTPVNFNPKGGLRFESPQTVRFEGEFPSRFVLKPGDLVTVLTDLSSKRLILGRAGIVSTEGILLNQRTARIDRHKGASEVSLRYLSYVLNSNIVREQVISTSRGSTVFHTSPTRMLAAKWPLPPPAEQDAILEHLGEVERLYDAAAAPLNAEIQKAGEYRTRLIADVVTGKLDVRKAAVKLPDEVDEPDGLERSDETPEGGEQGELVVADLAEEEVVA